MSRLKFRPQASLRSGSLRILAAALGASMAASASWGQVTPMLLRPWDDAQKPRIAETNDDILYIPGGDIDQNGDDIDIFYWDSIGRIKFDRDDNDPGFWLGYHVLQIELGGNPRGLAGGYTDLSLAGAFDLGQIGDGWDVSLAAGAGIATDNHLSDTDAIYGLATINLRKSLSQSGGLDLGVNYNGNRTFLPDIPLPYAMYHDRLGGDFNYYVGVPSTGFVWTPGDRWTIRADYTVPINVQASVSYELMEDTLSLFAEYRQTYDAFWIHDVDNRRTFYEMSRVVAGVRWIWGPWIDLSVGGGIAFDQEFSTGWDSRDTHTFASPSDEPVLFVNLRGTF